MICDTEVCGLGISTSLSQGSFVIHAVGTIGKSRYRKTYSESEWLSCVEYK